MVTKTPRKGGIKKLLTCGLITGFLFLVFDMLIGILTSPLLPPYSSLPIWKTPPDISAGVILDLINGFILVAVYMTIYDGIPGSGWIKGFNYGVIVGLFRVLMGAFSTLVMYNIPLTVILVNLVAGYVEILLLGTILALLYEKL